MLPQLYRDLTAWYPLVDPVADHRHEAARYCAEFRRAVGSGELRTLLELGAGAGNNAAHLKADLHCTLVDLSPEMSALSASANPECEHVLGDMRTFRCERTFDAVLVHDAIMYMTTRSDLAAAARTAFVHTRPGGAAIFAPDCVAETFAEMTELEGSGDEARSARFMMWSWDPDPSDEMYVVDFSFLLREGTEMRAVHDRHVEGVFPRAAWIEILTGVGYEVESLCKDVGEGRVEEIFLCRRPPT